MAYVHLGLSLMSLVAIVTGSAGLSLARSPPGGTWPNLPPMLKFGDGDYQKFVNQVVFGAWIGVGVCGLLSQIFWPGWVE